MPLKTRFLLGLEVIKQLRNNPQREKHNPLAGEKIRKIDFKTVFAIFAHFGFAF